MIVEITDTKPPLTSEAPFQNVHFKFLLTEHSNLKNAQAAVEEFKDCDVIAIEGVGLTKAERQEAEKTLNGLMQIERGSKEAKEILNGLARDGAGEDEIYFFDHLTGSNKTLFYIDISFDDPAYKIQVEKDRQFYDYAYTLLRNDTSIELSRKRLMIYLKTYGRLNSLREERVLEQLGQIASDHKPLTIGVYTGAVHTNPYHEVKKSKGSAERKFLRDGEVLSEKIFANSDRIIRSARFRPDKPLTEELVDKQILIDSANYILYLNDIVPNFSIIEDAVTGLPQKEVEQILTALEEIRKNREAKDRYPFNKDYLEVLLRRIPSIVPSNIVAAMQSK